METTTGNLSLAATIDLGVEDTLRDMPDLTEDMVWYDIATSVLDWWDGDPVEAAEYRIAHGLLPDHDTRAEEAAAAEHEARLARVRARRARVRHENKMHDAR